MSNYRAELIQVAAVAVAMLKDDLDGTTAPNARMGGMDTSKCITMEEIVSAIYNERQRQETKWGPQHHSKEKWFTILGEEFGEVGRAILEKN